MKTTGLHEIITESNGSMETSIQKIVRYICVSRHACYIYSKRQEKTRYLSNLFSRNIYNLKEISSGFKNLPDFEVVDNAARITDFELTNVESHCALCNAYKL